MKQMLLTLIVREVCGPAILEEEEIVCLLNKDGIDSKVEEQLEKVSEEYCEITGNTLEFEYKNAIVLNSGIDVSAANYLGIKMFPPNPENIWK